MQFDYNYLCQGIGHLTGLETRLYKKGLLRERYSQFKFEPDAISLIDKELVQKLIYGEENAFYMETDSSLIFGVIQSKKDKTALVIGPTSQLRPEKNEASAILHMLGESYHRLPEIIEYFSYMLPYPLENFLDIICFINYAVNNEKLSVSDLIIKNGLTQNFALENNRIEKNEIFENNRSENELLPEEPHNTYQAENLMLSYVTAGNVAAIHTFFKQSPTGRVGSIARNELRQRKNIFICSATLISRAAIAGGMAADISFSLSDKYIQKAELLEENNDLIALTMKMLLDYTERVETIKCGSDNSALAKKVMKYVLEHINEKIIIADMAKALRINRSYLSEQFHIDTGNTIKEFITSTKIGEAKRLLRTSSLSIAQISDCLSFSSQSYFQNVFKKLEGCTPKEYR